MREIIPTPTKNSIPLSYCKKLTKHSSNIIIYVASSIAGFSVYYKKESIIDFKSLDFARSSTPSLLDNILSRHQAHPSRA